MMMWKRRRVWLEGGLQARFTALIVGSVLGVLLAMGALYVQTLEEQRELVGINRVCASQNAGRDDEDAEFETDLQNRMLQTDNRRLLVLMGLAALLLLGLASVGIRLTFHIVGPALIVSSTLREWAAGRFRSVRALRKGDELRWLEDDLQSLRDALEVEANADADLLEEAAERLGPGPLTERLRLSSAVKRERFRKKQSVQAPESPAS